MIGRALLYGLWFALAVSLGEVAIWTWRKLTLVKVVGWQYLWMIPLGYVLIMSALAAASAVLGRISRTRHDTAVLAFLCSGVGTGGWLFLFGGLHRVAAAVLATGLAVQVARFVARRPESFERLVRRTTPTMIVVVAGLASASAVWNPVMESHQVERLPPPRASSPNVVLVVLDTVRARSLSVYGYARPTTPVLSRLASEGVVFDRAYSTSPWTLPSHGSMFTGRFPHEFGGSWNTPFDSRDVTLAEAMAGAGYLTAGFVANVRYVSREFGLAKGFMHFEDHPETVAAALRATSFGRVVGRKLRLTQEGSQEGFGLKSAADVNRQFLGWLAAADPARPYFAFLNYADAHTPYKVPAGYAPRFSKDRLAADLWSRDLDAWTADDVRRFNDAYDDTIAYVDEQVGVLLSELDRRGGSRSTVVVIVADHGEQFGEHNLVEHANSLYTPLLHVPFLIVGGGVPAGVRIDAPVSLRDLPATVMDTARLSDVAAFPGRSLGTLWSGGSGAPSTRSLLLAEVEQVTDAYPDHYPARKGPMQAIFFDGLQYIRNGGDGLEELFDVVSDPDGAVNLIDVNRPAAVQSREYLRRLLEELQRDRQRR